MEKAREIKAAVALVLSFLTGLWGWMGWAVLALIASMALDYLTGSWAAMARGEWSSAAAREGLRHKLGEIAALLVAALCDFAVKLVLQSAAAPLLGSLDYGDYMSLLVCVWYIFTELGSITENIGKLGAPLPPWLKKSVALLRGKTEHRAVGTLDSDGRKE